MGQGSGGPQPIEPSSDARPPSEAQESRTEEPGSGDDAPPSFEGSGLTTMFEGEWATVRRLRKGKLVITAGPDQGKELEMIKPRVTGGRSIICDLVLADKAVSGTHFEVAARDDGYRLRDPRA